MTEDTSPENSSEIQPNKVNVSKLLGKWKKKLEGKETNYQKLQEAPSEFQFESSSSPGKFYTVSIEENYYECNCPGFIYRKNCSHIDKARMKQLEPEISTESKTKKEFEIPDVNDEEMPVIFGMYLFGDTNTIRNRAKTIFEHKYAKSIVEFVNENFLIEEHKIELEDSNELGFWNHQTTLDWSGIVSKSGKCRICETKIRGAMFMMKKRGYYSGTEWNEKYCTSCYNKFDKTNNRYKFVAKWWKNNFEGIVSSGGLQKASVLRELEEKEKEKEKEKERIRKLERKKENLERKKEEKRKLTELGPTIYLADKIVKSKWGGASGNETAMKKMAESMKKGKVSSEILEEILWAYMFHKNSNTRAAAKKAFMEMAPEDAKEAVKKNWKASYRYSKEMANNLAELGKNMSHTKINFTNLLIKVLQNYDKPPHYLHQKDSSYDTQKDRYPTIEALGLIANAQAAGPLGQFMTRSLGSRWSSDWKVKAIPTITSSLVKLGEPAIEPLVEALKYASDSKVGLEDNQWYIGGKQLYKNYYPSTKIIVNALKELKWKPETDELLALQLVAMRKWSDCVKLGVPAVKPLIKVFEHNWDSEDNQQNVAKTLGKIGDVRAVRAMTGKDWGDWWNDDYRIKALGNIDDVSVISALLKALEKINEKTPRGSKRGVAGERFSIEELGMTEYYTNGLLKEIPSKPTFRKKYKIYGFGIKEASADIIKILSKFEKKIIKNGPDDYVETLLRGKTIEIKWTAVILQKIADKNLKGDEKKNALKFLESDDTGMILMGASMLKGIIKSNKK